MKPGMFSYIIHVVQYVHSVTRCDKASMKGTSLTGKKDCTCWLVNDTSPVGVETKLHKLFPLGYGFSILGRQITMAGSERRMLDLWTDCYFLNEATWFAKQNLIQNPASEWCMTARLTSDSNQIVKNTEPKESFMSRLVVAGGQNKSGYLKEPAFSSVFWKRAFSFLPDGNVTFLFCH